MKYLCFPFTILILFSCASKKEKDNEATINNSIVTDSVPSQNITDTVVLKDSVGITKMPVNEEPSKKIREYPADGKYRYDMAFAEFQNKSMGEKVTVIIKGDSIKIVYEGDGKLSAAKGAILDQGIIVKHKSGVWIIAKSIKDAELDEFGGCSGGPLIIDFIKKRYITC